MAKLVDTESYSEAEMGGDECLNLDRSWRSRPILDLLGPGSPGDWDTCVGRRCQARRLGTFAKAVLNAKVLSWHLFVIGFVTETICRDRVNSVTRCQYYVGRDGGIGRRGGLKNQVRGLPRNPKPHQIRTSGASGDPSRPHVDPPFVTERAGQLVLTDTGSLSRPAPLLVRVCARARRVSIVLLFSKTLKSPELFCKSMQSEVPEIRRISIRIRALRATT